MDRRNNILNLTTTTTTIQQPQQQQSQPLQRWCCVGARAEATLPWQYWKEFLLLGSALLEKDGSSSDNDGQMLQVELEFTGPDIPPVLPEQIISIDDGTMTIRGGHRGLYHEQPTEKILKDQTSCDAFLFFNPGFGHPNLQRSWEGTLSCILQQKDAGIDENRATILLTAHSERDAERDTDVLANRYGLVGVQYTINPFASRISYRDPFDGHHIVRPNHYVAVLSVP
jgi:hypothetical protein